MSLSFVHAADFHLGADLRRFGKARERLVDAQFRALEYTLSAAAERHAAFVLICGDLFDSRNPSPKIISRTASIFDRFRKVTVFVIPGTHDFLSEGAVLAPGRSIWAPPNVVILTDPESSPFYFEELDVCIHFRPNITNRSGQSPISGLKRTVKSRFHIALAHGSLSAGSAFGHDFPIDPDEIEKSGLDYLALGHWHSPRVESFGNTVAAYSGIPQPLSFSDPETGSVFFVNCHAAGAADPERVETSTIRLKKLSSTVYHPQDVKNLLELAPDPNTILKLDLLYSDNCIERLEVDEVIKHARSRYILVQKEKKQQKQPGSPPPIPDDVNQDLVHAYKAELDRLREADSPERGAIYEKALKMGTNIIKGDI